MSLEKLILEKGSNGMFTTLNCESLEAKKVIFNALNSNTSESCSTLDGETIKVVNVLLKEVEYPDPETGEIMHSTKVILILDDDRKIAASPSTKKTLALAFETFGVPTPENPLTFSVTLKPSIKNPMHKYVALDLL